MTEFTCTICGHKYNPMAGEPEERMCNNCCEYDDILDDKDEKEVNKYNLIKQRIDRENYKIGWKEKDEE